MKALIFVVISVIGIQSLAQDSFTLETYISGVLENDYGIRILRNDATIASNENNPGAAGYLPQISLLGEKNWTINSARQEFLSGQTNEANNAKNQSLALGAMLNWTFFDGFKMFITDKKLDLLEENAQYNVIAEMEMKIYRASLAYYTLLLLRDMNEVYKQSIDLSLSRKDQLETRLKSGASSEMQLIQARLDLTADSAVYLQNQRAIELLKAEMNILLARNPNSKIEVLGSLPDTISKLAWEQVKETAIQQNTSIMQSKINLAIREKEHKEVLSRYYPQLAFYAGYNYGSSQNEVGFLLSNRSFGPQFGLTLRWDILDGLTRMQGAKNTKLQIENAKLYEEQQTLQIEAELKNAFVEYEWAIRNLEFESRNALDNEEIARIMEKAFEAGALTPLELREIQFAIVLTQSRLLNAKLDYLTATLNISLATGDFRRLFGK